MRSLVFEPVPGQSVSLPLIQEANYSSEYMLRDPLGEIRLRIRHTKEKVVPGQQQFDRHNVEFTRTDYPSVEKPRGRTTQAYVVLRTDAQSEGLDGIGALMGLISILNSPGFIPGLVAWQSDFSSNA